MEQAPTTVHEVLSFPEVQRGHPAVLAGRGGLRREVTWVHVLELSSVSGLLRGGEMVLLTGVALPQTNDGLRRWVADLVAMGTSAAVIQLGERWAKLPAALVRAADQADLPLIGLHTVVPFVDITRVVLTAILDSSHSELQEAARVHEFFHRTALEGRSDEEVVMAVSWLAGASVVLENRNHHVIAFQTRPDHDSEALLRDWERRSRRNGPGEGWIVSEVQARGQQWGRLVASIGPDQIASRTQRLAVEQGAENLALRRAIEGDDLRFELESRSDLLAKLTRGYYRYEAEGRARAEAAGFPITGRTLVGIAVRAPGAAAEEIRLVVERCRAAAGLDLLLGADNAGLLSLPPQLDPMEALRPWTGRLRRSLESAVVGVGDRVTTMSMIRGSLGEAVSAADGEIASGGRRSVVRMADVRVRGLLAQLQADPRLHSFVERELGPLLESDQADDLDALRAYLTEGRNKSAAAQAVRVSRPAFYARLNRASAVLAVDLDDAETCMSLQLALLAHEITCATSAGATSMPTAAGHGRSPQAVNGCQCSIHSS